jgi:regulator of CtrA degradation
LTTRLMQLASWLLLHRAVKEGEMSLSQVNQEKTTVKLSPIFSADEDTLKLLPETLVSLIERSIGLADQVRRLDATIHAPTDMPRNTNNPVENQLGMLKAAFERKA